MQTQIPHDTALHSQKSGAVSQVAETAIRQYLAFTLAGELYAVDILKVREIIEFGSLTTIPMMPPTLRGVINLRGVVVPVIDLAIRFGGAATREARRTSIVIIEVPTAEAPLVLGVMVDGVNEVIEIASGDIAPAPEFGSQIRTDFIAGMGKTERGLVVLLDIAKVFSVKELAHFGSASDLANLH